MVAAPPRTPIPDISTLELEIETARLKLRPLAEGDVEDLWPYVSDPEFPRQMSWAAHEDKATTRDWLAASVKALADGTNIRWGIVYGGKVVGCVGLEGIKFQLAAWRVDRAELGYWIAPSLHGKGFMTEAATAVVKYAFETIGLHKVTVGCLVENDASRRVIEKLGFRYIGRQEDDVWRDGHWRSHLRYELTAPEWPDVHTTMRIDRRDVR